jgi:hypothetical protein
MTDEMAYPEEPEQNPDIAKILGGGGGGQTPAGTMSSGDDGDWDTDWSPDQGLMTEGWRNGVIANIEKTATRKGDAAVKWSVTDTETGRTVQRTVNLTGGSGIERVNISFAAALGVEPSINPETGRRQLPGGLLRKHIGEAIQWKCTHEDHWQEANRKIERLDGLRAPEKSAY